MNKSLICEGSCNGTHVSDFNAHAVKLGFGNHKLSRLRSLYPAEVEALLARVKAFLYTAHREVRLDFYACAACGHVRRYGKSLMA